jgi:hypothetical protein
MRNFPSTAGDGAAQDACWTRIAAAKDETRPGWPPPRQICLDFRRRNPENCLIRALR